MNRIDRLIIKAERAAGGAWYLALCIVDYDPVIGVYILKPQIWNGKPGEGRYLPETVHACRHGIDEAIAGYMQQYPTKQEPVIIEVDWV